MEGAGGSAPDTASAETSPEISSESDSGQPTRDGQDTPESSQANSSEGNATSDGQRLQELQEKAKDKDYRFSDEDLKLMEKAENGEITEEDSPEPEQPKSDPVQEALKEVGAKTPEELATKIKELKKFIGSRDAQAFKQLEAQHQELNKKADNHQKWIADLRAGRPEALEYLQKITNGQTLPQQPQSDSEAVFDEDEFISPEAGRKANQFIGSLKQQIQALQSKLDDVSTTSQEASKYYQKQSHEAQVNSARSEIKTELSAIALKPEYREFLLPKSGAIPELLDQYWKGDESQPVDPRIQPIVEIFDIAKSDYPHLLNEGKYNEAFAKAAKVIAFEKMQNKLLGAEQRGRQSIQTAKRSIVPSASGTKQESVYTTADVQAMVKGSKKIPDSWIDSYGNLDENKIPQSLRTALV
jgi:hypothetical protein